MSIWEFASRSAIVFVVLLVWSRILGKKLISQMTVFDFVAAITIGALGGGIILTDSVKIGGGLTALSVFCVLVLASALLALKSIRMRKIVNSDPTMLIRNGKILETEMAKVRLTMDNLLMMLRKKGAFYVDEVELAIFETDGTLSVLKKTDHLPVTNKDLRLKVPSRGQARVLIIDGRVIRESLKAAGKDMQWVTENLRKLGVEKIADVAMAQVDQTDQLYVDIRKETLLH